MSCTLFLEACAENVQKNMDPEAARDLQQTQASFASMQNSVQNMNVGESLATLFGGADVAGASGSKPSSQRSQASSTTPKGKSKGKRR
jgi:hypothetical protein